VEPKSDWRRPSGRRHGFATAIVPPHTLALSHTALQSLPLRSIHSPRWRCPRNVRLSLRYDGAHLSGSVVGRFSRHPPVSGSMAVVLSALCRLDPGHAKTRFSKVDSPPFDCGLTCSTWEVTPWRPSCMRQYWHRPFAATGRPAKALAARPFTACPKSVKPPRARETTARSIQPALSSCRSDWSRRPSLLPSMSS